MPFPVRAAHPEGPVLRREELAVEQRVPDPEQARVLPFPHDVPSLALQQVDDIAGTEREVLISYYRRRDEDEPLMPLLP